LSTTGHGRYGSDWKCILPPTISNPYKERGSFPHEVSCWCTHIDCQIPSRIAIHSKVLIQICRDLGLANLVLHYCPKQNAIQVCFQHLSKNSQPLVNTPKWLRAWPTWVRLKTRSKTQGPVLQKSCLRILTKLMKSRWLSQLGAVLDNRGRNRDAPYRKMTGHDIKIIQIQHQWLSIEKLRMPSPIADSTPGFQANQPAPGEAAYGSVSCSQPT
jgi:hypothetical protein